MMKNRSADSIILSPRISTFCGFALLAILCFARIASADLVTYWNFNESSSFSDSSGNGYTGRTVGSGLSVPNSGIVGKAFYGSTNGKYIIDVTNANVNLNNFSISFWCKQTGNVWRDYLTLYTGGEIQFQRNNNNSISVYGFPWGSFNLSTNLSSGFHHIVLTTNAATGDAKIYVDNVLNSTLNKSDVNFLIKNIVLGGYFYDAQRCGQATVDEVQFYDQTLTAEQVSYIYNNPSLYSATVYQRNVTSDGNWSDVAWNANEKTGQAFANSSAVELSAQNAPTLTLDKAVTVNSIDFDGSMTIDGTYTITLNGEKRITVANADDNVIVNVPIKTMYDNNFTKTGAGALTFAAANTYTGTTTISAGTLKLTGSATLGAGAVSVGKNAALEIAYDDPSKSINIPSISMSEGSVFNVASGTVTFGTSDVSLNNLAGGSLNADGTIDVASTVTVSGNLTINNDKKTKYIGSISAQTIKKTGNETLQLYTDASSGGIQAESFVVSSGRIDVKGCMAANVSVESGATFSPGNSVGTTDITGSFTLDSGATLLLEIGGETYDLNDQLIISGDFIIGNGAIIELLLADNSNFTSGDKFTAQIIANTLNGNNPDDGDVTSLFEGYLVPGWPFYDLSVTKEGNVYSIHGTYDPNAVPEPSTWAMLALGVVALFLRKRVKS